jgi:hypothetical protein
MLQTEFAFTLPCGYVDEQGNLHQQGTMRMATALDEVAPMQDARVRANELYLSILLLSRVVTRLGEISPVSPAVIERLFSADFVYLHVGPNLIETQCPTCGTRFALDLAENAGTEVS